MSVTEIPTAVPFGELLPSVKPSVPSLVVEGLDVTNAILALASHCDNFILGSLLVGIVWYLRGRKSRPTDT
jgi:hypothetical protein